MSRARRFSRATVAAFVGALVGAALAALLCAGCAALLCAGCAAPSHVTDDFPDLAGAVDLGAPDLARAGDLPAAVCGDGVCAPGEDGTSCGRDCCDANTPCAQTYDDDGTHYCRSMNGGAFGWYTAAQTTALCMDPSQIGVTTYVCAAEHGTCCSVPGGYVAGPCS